MTLLERTLSSPAARAGWRAALGDQRLRILALIWFLDNVGVYGFNFWLPIILKRLSGLSSAAAVTRASFRSQGQFELKLSF